MSGEYNGWTNYETWCVKLWIDNDQSEQEHWLEVARGTECVPVQYPGQSEDNARRNVLAELLKDAFEEANPLLGQATMWNDLMGAALGEVEWREIAESMLEDAKELPRWFSVDWRSGGTAVVRW